jgi:hypothetical protein
MLKLKYQFNVKIDNRFYKTDPHIERFNINPIPLRPNIYAQEDIFSFYLNIPKNNEHNILKIKENFIITKDWR